MKHNSKVIKRPWGNHTCTRGNKRLHSTAGYVREKHRQNNSHQHKWREPNKDRRMKKIGNRYVQTFSQISDEEQFIQTGSTTNIETMRTRFSLMMKKVWNYSLYTRDRICQYRGLWINSCDASRILGTSLQSRILKSEAVSAEVEFRCIYVFCQKISQHQVGCYVCGVYGWVLTILLYSMKDDTEISGTWSLQWICGGGESNLSIAWKGGSI